MCIQNPSKHQRWSFMEKKVNNSKPLAIYSKKLFDSLTIINNGIIKYYNRQS